MNADNQAYSSDKLVEEEQSESIISEKDEYQSNVDQASLHFEEEKEENPQLNDSGLEEVSDTDAPQLSHCNSPELEEGDDNDFINQNGEVVIEPPEKLFDNLEGLETETISDNEEFSLVDDDNIEEGEIPGENPKPNPSTIPKKCEQEEVKFIDPVRLLAESANIEPGDYEEGEIVEENTSLEVCDNTIEPEKVPEENIIEDKLKEVVSPSNVDVDDTDTISKNLSLFRKSTRPLIDHSYQGPEVETSNFRHSSISKDSEIDLDYRNKHTESTKSAFTKKDEKKKSKKSDYRHDNGKKYKSKEDKKQEKDEYGRDMSLRRINKPRNRHERRSRSRRRSPSFLRKSHKRKFSRSQSRSKKKRRRRRSYSTSTFSSSRSSGSRSRSKSYSKSPVYKNKIKRHHKDRKKSKISLRPKKRHKSKYYDSGSDGAQIVEVNDKKRSSKKTHRDSEPSKDNVASEKKKRSKNSSLQSKEVFQTGGNIMVSVNFPRQSGKSKESVIPKGNEKVHTTNDTNWSRNDNASISGHTPLQDEPMWSPKRNEGRPISVDGADDVILVTPPTPDPITISDSDDDHRHHRLQNNSAGRIQGPKTPPPLGGVRFNVISKQVLKTAVNPAFNGGDDELNAPAPAPPNDEFDIPPPPPQWTSPKVPHPSNEPSSYDPFQPTSPKSPSAVVKPSMMVAHEKTSDPSFLEDSDTTKNKNIFQGPPSHISPHKQLTATINHSTFDPINQTRHLNNIENKILSPSKNVFHDLPKTTNYAALTTTQGCADSGRIGNAHEIENNTHHRSFEAESPMTPDSSELSDFFEPPSPGKSKLNPQNKDKSLKKPYPRQKQAGGTFDGLFNSKPNTRSSANANRMNVTRSTKPSQPKEKPSGPLEDEIPRSAVDLQKAQRQERIAEEVKITLKPFFNKKMISKEDYKETMRKCVMKVCKSKSGEINPAKIRALVDAYIKRIRYQNKARNNPSALPNPIPQT